MRLEDLSKEERELVDPILRSIRHDLGKYICFEQRFVMDEGDADERRRAVRSDIENTHRRGDCSEGCVRLWSRLRPGMLDGDPDVLIVDKAIEDISLLNLEGPIAELDRAASLARSVQEASKRLLARFLVLEQAELDARPGGIENG